MTQAWQVRSSERQEILEKLKEDVMKYEDLHGRRFNYDLAIKLLEFLRNETSLLHDKSPEAAFVTGVLLNKLQVFSRGKEERDAIVSDVLSYLVNLITGRFRSDLDHAEVMNPRKFLKAKSHIDEIET